MEPLEIKDIILNLETSYDISTWRSKGVDCWPVIRQSIANQLAHKKITSKKAALHKRNAWQIWKDYRHAAQRLKKVGRVDQLFLANQIYRSELHGVSWNRFCDPLMNAIAEKHGKRSILIEESKTDAFIKNGHQEERLFAIDPILDWLAFKRLWLKRLRIVRRPKVPFINELNEAFEKIEAQTGKKLKVKKAINEIERLTLYTPVAERILRKLKPDKVHIVCYYGTWAMAMIYVARKMDVASSDIQHGVINELHLMYSHWSTMNRNGFNVLPNTFFTWSSYDQKVIETWTKNSEVHQAIRLGNPWLQIFKEKLSASTTDWKSYDQSKPLILYTLANRDDIFFDALVEFVKKAKDQYNLWFRLHPRQLPFKEEVLGRLNELGILDMINIEEATNLPLPEILAKTSLHITLISSVVIEAMHFDIPSLIVGELGEQYYKMYEETGLAYFASFEQFEERVDYLLKLKQKSGWESYDLETMAAKIL